MKRKAPSSRGAEAGQDRDPDEILPEYDPALIRQGERGKYSARYGEGTNVVLLDPDVAAAFPDAAAVNGALRALLQIARRQAPGAKRPPRSA